MLRPLYENLPAAIREKALAMMAEFDAASVVATSRFIASGEQPFGSAAELGTLAIPTLLVPGDDPIHPAEVSALYAENLPEVSVVNVPVTEAAGAIEAFCDRIAAQPPSVYSKT